MIYQVYVRSFADAALFISMLLPKALFLMFQRLFLRGTGLSGAVKG